VIDSIQIELDTLGERQRAAIVDGVGGAAHVGLPCIGPGFTSAAGPLLAAECAADLGARGADGSISVLLLPIIDLSHFGGDKFGDTSHCTGMIAKHHLPSLTRPRLTAERPSEDGGHESAFGGGRTLCFSNPARNCDDNVAVLNRRYGDRATGRSVFG
jgi:hypothetical protein